MVRINAIVEGRTEERFISGILAPYLAHKSIYMTPMRVFTSRSKNRRGGLGNYAKPRAELEFQRCGKCALILIHGLISLKDCKCPEGQKPNYRDTS